MPILLWTSVPELEPQPRLIKRVHARDRHRQQKRLAATPAFYAFTPVNSPHEMQIPSEDTKKLTEAMLFNCRMTSQSNSPLPAAPINNAQTASKVWQRRSNAHDVTLNQALSCCCSSRCLFKGRGCSHLIQDKTSCDSKVCTQ